MKRSDFISRVLEKNGEFTKTEVELLLEAFEQLGMLPPTRIERSVLPGIGDFTVNNWDPEDKDEEVRL